MDGSGAQLFDVKEVKPDPKDFNTIWFSIHLYSDPKPDLLYQLVIDITVNDANTLILKDYIRSDCITFKRWHILHPNDQVSMNSKSVSLYWKNAPNSKTLDRELSQILPNLEKFTIKTRFAHTCS